MGLLKQLKQWVHHPSNYTLFLLPEALGSLILAITTAIIGLIGSTAMAGAVGGGGIAFGFSVWLSTVRYNCHCDYSHCTYYYCSNYTNVR